MSTNIGAADALPRAYQLAPDEMANAYQAMDPNRYRYVYRSGVKWSRLKQDAIDASPFTIPFELRGKPDAPLLAMDLPGGPGSVQNDTWKEKFDVGLYRVIVADWRGVGRSAPIGEVNGNTTMQLVADIERLRRECARTPDEKIMLRGGSWGMTVAAAYAAAYPENVSGIVMGLPFLARRADTVWNYAPEGGMAARYPAAYRDFTARTGPVGVDDILAQYAMLLAGSDMQKKQAYAAWTEWEDARNGETGKVDIEKLDMDNPGLQQRIARARLMVAYTQADFYLGAAGIVQALQKIPADIPVTVVAHSKDPLCAPDSLDVLRLCLPQAQYMVKEADFHWVSPAAAKPEAGFDNSFVTQAYPFATTQMGLMLTGKMLKPQPPMALQSSMRGLRMPNV